MERIVGNECRHLLDCFRFNDKTAQSETAGKKENHAPHDVAFRIFPCQHDLAVFIFQKEHEKSAEKENISRFHRRKQSGKKRTDKGERRGKNEKEKPDFFSPFHLSE